MVWTPSRPGASAGRGGTSMRNRIHYYVVQLRICLRNCYVLYPALGYLSSGSWVGCRRAGVPCRGLPSRSVEHERSEHRPRAPRAWPRRTRRSHAAESRPPTTTQGCGSRRCCGRCAARCVRRAGRPTTGAARSSPSDVCARARRPPRRSRSGTGCAAGRDPTPVGRAVPGTRRWAAPARPGGRWRRCFRAAARPRPR